MKHDIQKLKAVCPKPHFYLLLNSINVIPLYNYYPWRKGDNPDTDYVTFKIINIKKKGNKGKDAYSRNHSINFFASALRKSIVPLVISANNVACVVPSHSKGDISEGLAGLITNVRQDFGFTNTHNLLERTVTVPKSSTGGDRSIQHHLDSIKAINHSEIYYKTVYLFDDVSSTGNSMAACKSILMDAGAREVIMIALGQTR